MVYMQDGRQGDVLRQIGPFSVKYVDVFSLQNLYVMMHELLLEEGWLGFDNQEVELLGHSDLETLYSESNFQKAIHKGGKEYWVWWRAQKQHEGRTSEYFLNTLDIDWHSVTTQPREVMHHGKKMNANFGDFEIFFTGRIISDIELKWENHALLKHVKKFYENRIIYAHIEKREKDLWREVYRLQSKVKAYLNLRTWMPTSEAFHPKQYGWEAPEQI